MDAQGAKESKVGDVDTRGAARDGDKPRICDVCGSDCGTRRASDPDLQEGVRVTAVSAESNRHADLGALSLRALCAAYLACSCLVPKVGRSRVYFKISASDNDINRHPNVLT